MDIDEMDAETIVQAYVNIVAGACISLGMVFLLIHMLFTTFSLSYSQPYHIYADTPRKRDYLKSVMINFAGLRFAGTKDANAQELLYEYAAYFLNEVLHKI